MLQDSGFTDVVIGAAVDTFGGAKGQDNARAFGVYGYALAASCQGTEGWASTIVRAG
jgi:glutamate mutase epsilon subunit